MSEFLIKILIFFLVWFLPFIIVYLGISIDFILHGTKPVYIKDIYKEVNSLDFFNIIWLPIVNWIFLGMIFVVIICENKIIRKTLGKITSFIGNIRLK